MVRDYKNEPQLSKCPTKFIRTVTAMSDGAGIRP